MTGQPDYLEHFGVKGMKWGKRKGSVETSKDHDAVKSIRKKKPSQMSNDELQTLNNRMNLEQNYKRLNPNKFSKGKTIAASIIGTVGMGVTVYNMVNGPAGQAAISQGRRLANGSKD